MKKIKGIFFLVLGFFSILSLGRTFKDIYERSQRIRGLESEVVSLERKQEELKEKIEEAKTPAFVEKEARERLGYVSPGEEVILVPKEQEDRSDLFLPSSDDFSTTSPSPLEQWVNLIF